MFGDRGAKGAEKRVQRFLTDYDTQWRAAAPAFDDRATRRDAFGVWRELRLPLGRDRPVVKIALDHGLHTVPPAATSQGVV